MDYNNTGAMRSPFSPRVRQSLPGRRPIGLSSAKKNQSKYNQTVEELGGDVIYKTPLITLETYGAPLPVMVTEALTFASGDVSVRLSPCGWCWVVSGRRVLAWPRSAGTDTPSSSGPSAARELTLPQTDLAHKADLVMLFYEDGAQMPSCIGVSPEGIVRYWASVGQEGAYVDVSCELAGQECERIASARSHGPLVLATTTCTLVLLTPTTVDGRATVTCRTLRPPSGWLGGIGRRVSLMFFGSMPAHVDTKLVGVVVLGSGGLEPGSSGCVALVAGSGAGSGAAGVGAGPVLQAWRGAELYEHSLRRALCDAHARPHLAPHGDPNSLEIVALDVRASGENGLLLLIAAFNVARSPEMRYSIAHISLEDLSSPRVTSLLSLRSWPVESDDSPRFLPLPTHVLLYTTKYIALVSSSGGGIGDKAEYVDVSAEGDRILGGELCGAALLFSARHGPLRLVPPSARALHSPASRSICESPMGSPCPSDMYDGNLSLYEIDPHEISAVTTDACGKLKTAFLFHLRRETSSCRDIIHQLFPPPPPALASPARRGDEPDLEDDVDNVLDRTVLKIATEMLDDMPAGDPRWKSGAGAASRVALGSSAALQVAAQLQDKKRAYTLFIDFLRATGLWHRLGKITSGGAVVRTETALCSLAEQLAAALALRSLQQGADAHLIDAAIYQVVCGGGEGAESEWAASEEEEEVLSALGCGALSASDVSYRRVSRTTRVLAALAHCRAHHAAPPQQRARHAAAALRLINSVVSAMQLARAAWPGCPPAPAPAPAPARALLPALLDLHTRAVTQCAHNCPDPNLRSQVLEGAATLASIILSEAMPLANNSQTAHLFNKMRRDTIQPYIDEGQLERAAVLAEKFKDFSLLIHMCIQADDLERLYSYIDSYTNEGMCELTFAWLGDRGGRHTVTLLRHVGARYSSRFSAWVGAAPARCALSAALHLHAQQYARASDALLHLAREERHSVQRMTTMASLAKLCLVASEEKDSPPSTQWRKIESCLALGEQHAALPRDIRLHNGLDAEDTAVQQPDELIQMYIDSKSKSLTEYDYKKALDLTDYVQDMERRDDLRLRVWCACIVRDDWSQCCMESPAEELQTKMFFRLLDLVHVMGGDLELLLPPLEDILTAPELAELVSDPRFHFIIKYGYECIDTTRNESMLEV